MNARAERWLRWLLGVIGLSTVASGAVQLVAPGFVLGVMGGVSSPTSRHFFGIVGMFMVLFGGMLLQAVARPKESSAAFRWVGLQKLGACAAVSLGVFRGLFSPIALSVAGFDLLSAALVFGYLDLLRRPARKDVVYKRPPVAPSAGELRPSTLPVTAAPQANERKRALILAGGGMRVAWQAGVLRALEDAGIAFTHADGTSGGIINLAMLLSGQSPAEMCNRWRTLRVKDFVSFVSPEKYFEAWDMEALGDADGIVERVFPHLGIDVNAIRAHTTLTGTFNVCDFARKTNEAIPHTQVDQELLVAGISLPIFMPPIRQGGRVYMDSVWIQDANLLEAVRRGADELWVLWCIANTPTYARGVFHQYVHMIELSANGALFEQLERLQEINDRIRAGEEVWGHRRPIVVHLIKPEQPLPLDPEFYAGHITAGSLIDMGYADACRYLQTRAEQGLSLTPEITQMYPSGADLAFRETMSGPLALGETDPVAGAGSNRADPFTFHATISVDDMDAFIQDPQHAARLVAHVSFPPFGDDIPVKRGSFNLFRSGDTPNTRLMTYGMAFDHQGREYYLAGTKTIRDDAGPDLWRDTTRLYCHLHEGPDERGPVVGAGVLELGVRDVLDLVSSMRSFRGEGEGLKAVARFGQFFFGTLWDVYAPLAKEREEKEREASKREASAAPGGKGASS
ncbi:patatin-like phospholipase family protein [Polyangium jinanense]|uniref:Patatin-like phospholipase family protein n=1 Tax=Polyangium jinanense TaxID=2829994 RepID=A0A9X3XCS8_9BACT|nr:patatin-like phospholipase family protein [Polyangium jinanense]MDC3960662.1 patatin-like phospholipase family protein [Polyangium jinanense]MDC3986950.1 patatin-like phospholipase family protein [Polyangium jinanense]